MQPIAPAQTQRRKTLPDIKIKKRGASERDGFVNEAQVRYEKHCSSAKKNRPSNEASGRKRKASEQAVALGGGGTQHERGPKHRRLKCADAIQYRQYAEQ